MDREQELQAVLKNKYTGGEEKESSNSLQIQKAPEEIVRPETKKDRWATDSSEEREREEEEKTTNTEEEIAEPGTEAADAQIDSNKQAIQLENKDLEPPPPHPLSIETIALYLKQAKEKATENTENDIFNNLRKPIIPDLRNLHL
jgi:hypothetical protein